MDTILEAQLQRIETAFTTLVDSIIRYDPSPAHADLLLQADDDLSKGLEQLERHQQNYTRILALRHELASNDAKIKSNVQALADVRKELLAIPLDVKKENAKAVPYRELLAYAKHIAPFTIPSYFRPKPTPPAQTETQVTTAKASQAQSPANQGEKADGEPSVEEAEQEDQLKAVKQLSEPEKAWITDLNKLPFQPWPGQEQIDGGALRALSNMVAHAGDPTEISAQEYVREERGASVEAERARERARPREVALGGEETVRPPKRKAMFGLEDDDDDDEDEDDD